MLYNLSTGDFSSYEKKGILSAPIFIDNVACYGLEDKLIDCTYHTDTTGEEHINDIWINCNATSNTHVVINHSESPNMSEKLNGTVGAAGLVFSLIGLSISILVIAFLVCYIVYRHKSINHTNNK